MQAFIVRTVHVSVSLFIRSVMSVKSQI